MDTPFDPTLADDIKQLLTEVPPPIRAVFASGKVEAVAKNLMQKNQLHIDQGAIVEREIILLLLGLKSPGEFTQTLALEANLNQQTVSGIVQDVNTQIFIPLRDEMMVGAKTTQQPVRPVAPPPSRSKPVVPAPAQPTSHFHLENKLPPPVPPTPKAPPPSSSRIAPLPPKFVLPRPTVTSREGGPSANPALREVLSVVTKKQEPMESNKLLEDHEEPHLDVSDKVQGVSLPGTEPPIPVPLTPYPSYSASSPPVSPKASPVQSYTTDPYRELIDGN